MVRAVYEIEIGGKIYTIPFINGGSAGYIVEEAEEKNEPAAYIVPLSSGLLEVMIDLTTTEFALTKETQEVLRKLVRELHKKLSQMIMSMCLEMSCGLRSTVIGCPFLYLTALLMKRLPMLQK